MARHSRFLCKFDRSVRERGLFCVRALLVGGQGVLAAKSRSIGALLDERAVTRGSLTDGKCLVWRAKQAFRR